MRCVRFALFALLMASPVWAQTIVGSKHDLRRSGGLDEVCIYCHTPHNASAENTTPLWNRKLGPVTFTPYTSATLTSQCPATPGQESLACLSCHDGVDAENDKHILVSVPGGNTGGQAGKCEACHTIHGMRGMRLKPAIATPGLDLSNDHPISMVYPSAEQNPQLKQPPVAAGWPDAGGVDGTGLRLFNGRVECPTCHNVHSPRFAPFLRTPNDRSAVCLTCHLK
jgi:predicted CXXCH cytochrome family protein